MKRSPQQRCRVVAVDVGAVRRNFAWASLDLPGTGVSEAGTNPEGAAQAVHQAVADDVPVALGFEAPIMVPVSSVDEPNGWQTLGKARKGESDDGQSRPWSAGAGSGALATGLVQLAWVLERVSSLSGGLRCTTQADVWLKAEAELFIWEAFVSGPGKPAPAGATQHAADAAAAGDTFAARLAEARLASSDVTCDASSLNLAAAAAGYAGLSIPGDEIRQPVHVYRTQPAA